MKKLSSISRRSFVTGVAKSAVIASAPFILTNRAQAAPHKLVFAHTFSPATEKYVVTGIDLFKERAEEYSDGELVVDLHGSSKLGGMNVLPQKLQSGAIHGCQLAMQVFARFSESLNLLDMPYLFPSSEGLEKALESEWFIESKLGQDAVKKGFQMLPGMWSNSGYRVLGIGKRPGREVRVPADLDGLKIRVSPARVEQKAWSLTPASHVSIAWAEAYQAMQQGVVDGLNVGMGPIAATRINETMASASLIQMTFNSHVTVLSPKWLGKVPEKVRSAIWRASAESWEHQKTEQRAANKRIEEEWANSGVKIVKLSDDEREQWVTAVGHTRPDWKELKERYGSAEYEKLLELGNS